MIRALAGLLLFVADIWAIIRIAQSKAGTGEKIIWVVLILFLPFIGLVAWYFIGPGTKTV